MEVGQYFKYFGILKLIENDVYINKELLRFLKQFLIVWVFISMIILQMVFVKNVDSRRYDLIYYI